MKKAFWLPAVNKKKEEEKQRCLNPILKLTIKFSFSLSVYHLHRTQNCMTYSWNSHRTLDNIEKSNNSIFSHSRLCVCDCAFCVEWEMKRKKADAEQTNSICNCSALCLRPATVNQTIHAQEIKGTSKEIRKIKNQIDIYIFLATYLIWESLFATAAFAPFSRSKFRVWGFRSTQNFLLIESEEKSKKKTTKPKIERLPFLRWNRIPLK